MFRTITRLLFGEDEEAPKDAKAGEVEEEGWLVVSHQEASSAENHNARLTDVKQSNSPHGNATENMENNSMNGEPLAPGTSPTTTPALSASSFQPKTLAELTGLTCIHNAKARADRNHASRNAIQRQNRLRQGMQQHAFHLQQPGHRSLGH